MSSLFLVVHVGLAGSGRRDGLCSGGHKDGGHKILEPQLILLAFLAGPPPVGAGDGQLQRLVQLLITGDTEGFRVVAQREVLGLVRFHCVDHACERPFVHQASGWWWRGVLS